jgi:hypothetical protein
LCRESSLTHTEQGLETEKANEDNVENFKTELKRWYDKKENEPDIDAKCEKKVSAGDRVSADNSPDIEWYVDILSVITYFLAL